MIKLLSVNRSVLGVYRLNGSALSNEYLYDIDASTLNADVVSYPYVKMAGSTYWASSLSNWVDQPTYIYRQRIDLSRVKAYSSENIIKMNATSLPANEVSPSSTFTSIYFNIFSLYSNPTVDADNCVDPFGYSYGNNYQVYVLWCPLISQAVNDINFNYPIYPPEMGSGFPFTIAFAYAYSNTAGNMIGYRLESEAGGVAAACTTVKNNAY